METLLRKLFDKERIICDEKFKLNCSTLEHKLTEGPPAATADSGAVGGPHFPPSHWHELRWSGNSGKVQRRKLINLINYITLHEYEILMAV